jgi:hypothetical protein
MYINDYFDVCPSIFAIAIDSASGLCPTHLYNAAMPVGHMRCSAPSAIYISSIARNWYSPPAIWV